MFAIAPFSPPLTAQPASENVAADAAAPDNGADPTDPADDSLAEPLPQPAPQPVTRFELQIELEDRLAAGETAAAAALGDPLLVLAAEEFGTGSTEYAQTLLLVAEAHKANENYTAAEETALRAVEAYREAEGTFAEALIGPYVALGDIYEAAGDYLNAMPAYDEARTISRRVNGLLDLGQIDILERMSATAEEMGEMEEAQEYQQDALMLVERQHDPHSPEVVAAAVRYGTWLRDHNLFTQEHALYTRVERAVTNEFEDDAIELIPLLRARANSFRTQALNHPLGIGSLERAMEILAVTPVPLLIAEVQRDLGDWQAAFNEDGSDGTAYLNAWNALADVPEGDALREAWFGEFPTRFVLLAARTQRGFSTDPDAATGRLIIRFTVLPSGLTSDVEISDADPPGIAETAFLRQFRASRFRPMIRDGRLVPARRGFSAEFRYDPKRYD